MTTLEDTRKVRDKLSRNSRWCKGDAAKDSRHMPVRPIHPDACQWCLAGAISRVTSGYRPNQEHGHHTRFCRAYNAISEHIERYKSVEEFNDAAETEHQDILNLLDKTINTLEARETHEHT